MIGNHDHDKAIGMDTEADHSFRAAFGPTYYSYNIGDCHFVVLDDVLYTGSSNYTAEITEAQMAWLEQDLKHVPKDKLIIIGVHIATSRRNRPTSHIANYRELYALLDGYNVRILSGHSHNNYTTTISETIEENTLGAVMGAYWNGEELCNDGSPRGYAVYEIEGNRIANWYYKGTAYPKEYQMYLYGPGQAVSEQYRDGLIFNIFNWHSTWTVRGPGGRCRLDDPALRIEPEIRDGPPGLRLHVRRHQTRAPPDGRTGDEQRPHVLLRTVVRDVERSHGKGVRPLRKRLYREYPERIEPITKNRIPSPHRRNERCGEFFNWFFNP